MNWAPKIKPLRKSPKLLIVEGSRFARLFGLEIPFLPVVVVSSVVEVSPVEVSSAEELSPEELSAYINLFLCAD